MIVLAGSDNVFIPFCLPIFSKYRKYLVSIYLFYDEKENEETSSEGKNRF